MQWKVKVEAIVKRVETIDYDIEAKTGDEARARYWNYLILVHKVTKPRTLWA